MKLNWGTGITVVYVFFIIGTLTIVFIFMNQDVTLEKDNYYSEGLAYQQQIDKINRTKSLPEQLEIIQEEALIKFIFPNFFQKKSISGTIFFYRPSDSGKDFSISINTDTTNIQTVSVLDFEKGLWKIKVDWNSNENSYYNEKILILN